MPESVVYDDDKFYRTDCLDARDVVLCGIAFPAGFYSYQQRVNTYKEILENGLTGALFKSDLLVQIPLKNGDVFVGSKIPGNMRKIFDQAELVTGLALDPIESILTDQEAIDQLQAFISNIPIDAKDPFINKFSGFLEKYKLLQPIIGGSLNIAQYLSVREVLNTSSEMYYYSAFLNNFANFLDSSNVTVADQALIEAIRTISFQYEKGALGALDRIVEELEEVELNTLIAVLDTFDKEIAAILAPKLKHAISGTKYLGKHTHYVSVGKIAGAIDLLVAFYEVYNFSSNVYHKASSSMTLGFALNVYYQYFELQTRNRFVYDENNTQFLKYEYIDDKEMAIFDRFSSSFMLDYYFSILSRIDPNFTNGLLAFAKLGVNVLTTNPFGAATSTFAIGAELGKTINKYFISEDDFQSASDSAQYLMNNYISKSFALTKWGDALAYAYVSPNGLIA